MTDVKAIFESASELDGFVRVDGTHPMDIYVGIDDIARWTLLVICPNNPGNVGSSQRISIKIGQRRDLRWAISFSLTDNNFGDMFALFCSDIIDSSRSMCDKDKGTQYIIRRYEEWKKMLAGSRTGLLSPEEIKGLLGEMYVLDDVLMDKYGSEKAALGWTGPRMAHQDFSIEDTWYEVKTISSGKDEVKISSIEQLDCENDGHLIIVFADNTSLVNDRMVNLNSIYYELLQKVQSDDVKEQFSDMLLKYGYFPRPEYETMDYMFEIKGVHHYKVDETFPCLRKLNLPTGIVRAEYTIALSSIKQYMEE